MEGQNLSTETRSVFSSDSEDSELILTSDPSSDTITDIDENANQYSDADSDFDSDDDYDSEISSNDHNPGEILDLFDVAALTLDFMGRFIEGCTLENIEHYLHEEPDVLDPEVREFFLSVINAGKQICTLINYLAIHLVLHKYGLTNNFEIERRKLCTQFYRDAFEDMCMGVPKLELAPLSDVQRIGCMRVYAEHRETMGDVAAYIVQSGDNEDDIEQLIEELEDELHTIFSSYQVILDPDDAQQTEDTILIDSMPARVWSNFAIKLLTSRPVAKSSIPARRRAFTI